MSLSGKLDNMMGSVGRRVTELNREVIKMRKESDRRLESQVEKNIVYEKIIDEVKQHDIKQDERLNDFEAEVKKLKEQVSSGSTPEQRGGASATFGDEGDGLLRTPGP